MNRRSSFMSMKEMSDVNMTPLIDLTFLLLVTFIITFPLLEQGIPLNLPEEKASDIQPDKSQIVSITAKGTLYLNDAEVSEKELSDRLKAMSDKASVTVLVRADKDNRYADVARVLRIIYESKVAKMALMTQGDDKK